MGMTAVEKILARASLQTSVRSGDIVFPKPDIVIVHDGLIAAAKQELDEIGIDEVFDPDRVYFVTDHDVIYTNPRAVERGFKNRLAAKEWGIKNFFDAGKGGQGHIFPMLRGIITPGMFYFDNDRHCTSSGAMGAFGLRAGHEISSVLATGTLWTKVPPSIRLTLKGKVQPGVFARDVGFLMASGLKKDGFFGVNVDYRVLELSGDLDQFNLDQRVALTSSPTEMRAVGVFVPPSNDVLKLANERAQKPFTPVFSDLDAEFEAEIELDIGSLEPQVVRMGGPHNTTNILNVVGTEIHHAFIGSCGSGMHEDLVLAAKILKDKKVSPSVRLFVVPGSEESTKRLHSEGLMGVFLDAGAFVLPAGCGLCSGGKMGLIHPGEVSISTAVGNQAGRFGGVKEAELFLGSPATVAASAIHGEITDPRVYGEEIAMSERTLS